MAEIGQAIANANHTVEATAVTNYLNIGFTAKDNNAAKVADNHVAGAPNEPATYDYAPSTIKIDINKKIYDIPVTVLLHNTSMRLEQVDLKLKFHVSEENGEVMVDCANANSDDATLSEMTLQFKNAPTTEGMARISENYINKL